MGENDFNTVSMIASERNDIGITASSTPSGARGVFYRMCTDKRPISQAALGYSEHYHPSQDNPYYTKEMDDRERAECTQTQYEHEILAIFGTEEAGVFDKSQVDAATKKEFYIYNPLTDIQKRNLKDDYPPTEYLYTEDNPAPYNPFRCMGIDWDSTQAGSSLLILDFDTTRKSFKVIKTVEVPRGEYTLDKAVQWVVKLNQIYRPSWIFCDRGYGGYEFK